MEVCVPLVLLMWWERDTANNILTKGWRLIVLLLEWFGYKLLLIVFGEKELKVGDVYTRLSRPTMLHKKTWGCCVSQNFLSFFHFLSGFLSRRTFEKWVFLSLLVQCSKTFSFLSLFLFFFSNSNDNGNDNSSSKF